MASPEEVQQRANPSRSTGSNNSANGSTSGRGSRQNPAQQLSTIEKSVTHLLVATKQLLETLTLWSRGSASEGEVSDVYVRLGYEFNIACRAFNAIGVDTADLGPVPDLLRGILEDALSQEASQASLDKYLPRIRDIIINLLHGLKKKQQRLRQKNAAGALEDAARPPRHASTSSVSSNLTEQLDNVPSRHTSNRSYLVGEPQQHPDLPPRTTSVQAAAGGSAGDRTSPRRNDQLNPQNSVRPSTSSNTLASDSGSSSLSSNALHNIPIITPYPDAETMPPTEVYEAPSPEPPRPPPKQNDALTALQRGGDLERRASRRFSAYQIQKHLGPNVNGMSPIPPPQHSPLPNRGRDVKESMTAVRSRGSVLHSRARSRHNKELDSSPNRQTDVRRISEETSEEPLPPPPPEKQYRGLEGPESPLIKTPEDKLGFGFPFTQHEQLGATLNGPLDTPFAIPEHAQQQHYPPAPAARHSTTQQHRITPPPSQFVPESSPQAGKELTLFLQYKSQIKKFVLPDAADLSVPRLQLAFIEKFAWNTHNHGVDLPEIYIQDPVSGVRHELEDLADIKERAVLALNVEALDEVKRHIDDGLGGLRRVVEGIKTAVEEQHVALRSVAEAQQTSAKEMAGLAALAVVVPPALPPRADTPSSSTPSRTGSLSTRTGRLSGNAKSAAGTTGSRVADLHALRRDLAIVRQTYNTFVSDTLGSMTALKAKAATLQQLPPSHPSAMDPSPGRAYVHAGKATLSQSSEKIVNRVDDLQDIVEDLRKDVVTRGVRPLPRQLESVSKDISLATAELKKLQGFLKKEKPVWMKIWEGELQVVCDDRDLLTMQEELAADLEDDLEKAARTFELVEQATRQQQNSVATSSFVASQAHAQGGVGGLMTSATPRSLSRSGAVADAAKAKDGVLGEVRALQPNHESRLEAIERAERARQKELERRREGAFERELGNFVEEGKLRKSGGVEEVERIRKAREERVRKEVFERMAQREREKQEKQGEKQGERQGEKQGEKQLGGNEGGQAQAHTQEPEHGAAERLEVPSSAELKQNGREIERENSPEPVFVEAKEEVGTPSTESSMHGLA